jgi:hypothetical protein
MSRDEAIEQVLAGLSFLIMHNATCAAREQYAPQCNPDSSDDEIKERKEFVAKLRELRIEFENVVTGLS